jgi:protein farnesyltransferase/geranylgeranyltransferase type-1 subunit alpha
VPISQPEGLEPVVQILYNKEYSDAMGLLRAIMMKGELSARALHLTSVIVFMNSAHFTVWEFRRCILHSMKSRGAWLGELEFMMEINQINTKNYQLWNHRRAVVKALLPLAESNSLRMDTLRSDHALEKELAHLNAILEEDKKHYHAWVRSSPFLFCLILQLTRFDSLICSAVFHLLVSLSLSLSGSPTVVVEKIPHRNRWN